MTDDNLITMAELAMEAGLNRQLFNNADDLSMFPPHQTIERNGKFRDDTKFVKRELLSRVGSGYSCTYLVSTERRLHRYATVELIIQRRSSSRCLVATQPFHCYYLNTIV